jgi:site-specific DNA-methyltransferase (adenine-specific)
MFPMSSHKVKQRAGRNRTVELKPEDRERLRPQLIPFPSAKFDAPPQGTMIGDCVRAASLLPRGFVDLLILDPPYNLNKTFNGRKFSQSSVEDYANWLDGVVAAFEPLLKSTATIYVCGDWLTSASIFKVCSGRFVVRNRITWEREKGRGAQSNWKNCSEDIWFCTRSDNYTFNVDAVKLRRRVIAPYRNGDGTPKDWTEQTTGNFRDTYPSNLWTDISIPFWSMPENTDHPTQKAEKLIAKLVLASTLPGDFVFDPFLGSGTSSVVAKKLGRRYLGVEQDEEFCLLAERRLELAQSRRDIQGFADSVFWERNTLAIQQKQVPGNGTSPTERLLFSNAMEGNDGHDTQ